MKCFIIHGAFGDPGEGWFPWLKGELEELGYEVIVPCFPTPEKQSLEAWLKDFAEYEQNWDPDTILVGHSLGPAFLLDVLQRRRAKAAFFVAPFISLLGNETFDSINATFMNTHFDWDAITHNCPRFTIFHSDNDPYVPIKKAEEVARLLSVGMTLVEGAGHFNVAAGYTTFPQLLAAIKEL